MDTNNPKIKVTALTDQKIAEMMNSHAKIDRVTSDAHRTIRMSQLTTAIDNYGGLEAYRQVAEVYTDKQVQHGFYDPSKLDQAFDAYLKELQQTDPATYEKIKNHIYEARLEAHKHAESEFETRQSRRTYKLDGTDAVREKEELIHTKTDQAEKKIKQDEMRQRFIKDNGLIQGHIFGDKGKPMQSVWFKPTNGTLFSVNDVMAMPEGAYTNFALVGDRNDYYESLQKRRVNMKAYAAGLKNVQNDLKVASQVAKAQGVFNSRVMFSETSAEFLGIEHRPEGYSSIEAAKIVGRHLESGEFGRQGMFKEVMGDKVDEYLLSRANTAVGWMHSEYTKSERPVKDLMIEQWPKPDYEEYRQAGALHEYDDAVRDWQSRMEFLGQSELTPYGQLQAQIRQHKDEIERAKEEHASYEPWRENENDAQFTLEHFMDDGQNADLFDANQAQQETDDIFAQKRLEEWHKQNHQHVLTPQQDLKYRLENYAMNRINGTYTQEELAQVQKWTKETGNGHLVYQMHDDLVPIRIGPVQRVERGEVGTYHMEATQAYAQLNTKTDLTLKSKQGEALDLLDQIFERTNQTMQDERVAHLNRLQQTDAIIFGRRNNAVEISLDAESQKALGTDYLTFTKRDLVQYAFQDQKHLETGLPEIFKDTVLERAPWMINLGEMKKAGTSRNIMTNVLLGMMDGNIPMYIDMNELQANKEFNALMDSIHTFRGTDEAVQKRIAAVVKQNMMGGTLREFFNLSNTVNKAMMSDGGPQHTAEALYDHLSSIHEVQGLGAPSKRQMLGAIDEMQSTIDNHEHLNELRSFINNNFDHLANPKNPISTEQLAERESGEVLDGLTENDRTGRNHAELQNEFIIDENATGFEDQFGSVGGKRKGPSGERGWKMPSPEKINDLSHGQSLRRYIADYAAYVHNRKVNQGDRRNLGDLVSDYMGANRDYGAASLFEDIENGVIDHPGFTNVPTFLKEVGLKLNVNDKQTMDALLPYLNDPSLEVGGRMNVYNPFTDKTEMANVKLMAKDREVLAFNQDLGIYHKLVENKSEATYGLDPAAIEHEYEQVRANPMGQYHPIKSGKNIPVMMNHPMDVTTASRMGKERLPQTVGETFMNAADIVNGRKSAVSFDIETTGLGADAKPLELSLREYHYDPNKGMVQDRATRMFVRPDEGMIQRVKEADPAKQFLEDLKRDLGVPTRKVETNELVAEGVKKIATVPEQLNSFEDLDRLVREGKFSRAQLNTYFQNHADTGFLRNIAKYAGSENTKTWAGYDYAPFVEGRNAAQSLNGFFNALKSDAETGIHNLKNMETAGDVVVVDNVSQALKHANKIMKDKVIIAQNGGRAEGEWMKAFANNVKETDRANVERVHSEKINKELAPLIKAFDTPDWILHDWNNHVAGYDMAFKMATDKQMRDYSRAWVRDQLMQNPNSAADADLLQEKGENIFGDRFVLPNQSTLTRWSNELKGTSLDMNNPMVELMHLSRAQSENGSDRHRLIDMVERAYGKEAAQTFADEAHFAHADTEMTARLFNHFVHGNEQVKDFTPDWLQTGDILVKHRSTGDQMERGVYEVQGYKDGHIILQDARGDIHHYGAASTNELNARINSNFIRTGNGEKGRAAATGLADDLTWQDAREDITKGRNNYTTFMNNRIKAAAMQMSPDGGGDGTADLGFMHGRYKDAIRDMEAGGNSDPVLIRNQNALYDLNRKDYISPRMREANTLNADWFNSREADVWEEYLQHIHDMQSVGAIDHKQKSQMVRNMQQAIEVVGGEKEKRPVQGLIDIGQIDAAGEAFAGNRHLRAYSPQDVLQGMWNIVGDLSKETPGASPNDRRSAAVTRLMKHLQSQDLGVLSGDVTDFSEQSMEKVARRLYNNYADPNNDKVADALVKDDMQVVINNDEKYAAARGRMQELIETQKQQMSPLARLNYEATRETRSRIESQYGELSPRMNYATGANVEGMRGTTFHNAQFAFHDGNQLREIMLGGGEDANAAGYELYQRATRNPNKYSFQGRDLDQEDAIGALGWNNEDAGEWLNPVGGEKTFGKRLKDLNEGTLWSIAGNQKYAYQPIRERMVDYLTQRQKQSEDESAAQYTEHEAGPSPAEEAIRSNPFDSAANNGTMGEEISDALPTKRYEPKYADPSTWLPDKLTESGKLSKWAGDIRETAQKAMQSPAARWMGLGALAVAGGYVLKNWITDPTPESRPDGDAPNIDGQYLNSSNPEQHYPNSRSVRMKENDDGMSVRIRGRDAKGLDYAELGDATGRSIRSAVDHQTNIRVQTNDNSQNIDKHWVQQQFANALS